MIGGPERCHVCGRTDRTVCDAHGHVSRSAHRANATTRDLYVGTDIAPEPEPIHERFDVEAETPPLTGRTRSRDLPRPPLPEREPEGDALPHGCITSEALRALADAMIRLGRMHDHMNGKASDTPCLRRIESAPDGCLVAHVSTGPAVGGTWLALVLEATGDWKIRD